MALPRLRSGRGKVEPEIPDSPTMLERCAQPTDLQASSPLFSVLPTELRLLIFQYALAEDEDLSKPFPMDYSTIHYRRPGFFHERRVDLNVLLTCQRTYFEARAMAFAGVTHMFWFDSSRAYRTANPLYFQNLPLRLQQQVNHVHVHCQLSFLENGSFQKFFPVSSFHPKTLTLTIRHTDFWNWDSHSPLRFKNKTWFDRFIVPASVRTFNLELETLPASQRPSHAPPCDWESELNALATTLHSKKLKRTDGTLLTTRAANPKTYTWLACSPYPDPEADKLRHSLKHNGRTTDSFSEWARLQANPEAKAAHEAMVQRVLAPVEYTVAVVQWSLLDDHGHRFAGWETEVLRLQDAAAGSSVHANSGVRYEVMRKDTPRIYRAFNDAVKHVGLDAVPKRQKRS